MIGIKITEKGEKLILKKYIEFLKKIGYLKKQVRF